MRPFDYVAVSGLVISVLYLLAAAKVGKLPH
jgi:hypothetical protein